MKWRYGWIIFGWVCLSAAKAAVCSETEKVVEENTSEALEMIASQMQALSSSLDGMPEPPQLNQTLVLPVEPSQEKALPPEK